MPEEFGPERKRERERKPQRRKDTGMGGEEIDTSLQLLLSCVENSQCIQCTIQGTPFSLLVIALPWN
jgi:hypothetical protein